MLLDQKCLTDLHVAKAVFPKGLTKIQGPLAGLPNCLTDLAAIFCDSVATAPDLTWMSD
jgi:hypothetical protein